MQIIEIYPYPLIVGLCLILYALIRNRMRGWFFLLVLFLFGLYVLEVINLVLFPLRIPENWPAILTWAQITHLHNLNLIPFDFGSLFSNIASGRQPAWVAYMQIGGNILLTGPFGLGITFLTGVRGLKVVWIALGVGLALEGLQLLTVQFLRNPHAVDINDVLTNALGVIIGYGLFQAAKTLYARVKPLPINSPYP